jgi:hypothetical protein
MVALRAVFNISDTLPPLRLRDIRGYLWFGVCGLLLLMLGTFPDSAAVRWMITAALVGWVLVPLRGTVMGRDASAQSEGARVIAAQIRLYALAVITFSLVFAYWARHLGLTWPAVIGAVFLIDAFANMIASLTEWWRLSMFGHSLGLMICGLCFPFVDKDNWTLVFGAAVVAGSLLASAILYLQVQAYEKTHSLASCDDSAL